MHVLVASVDLHIPSSQSLKEKRSVVLSIVRHLDQLHGVAASEVDHVELWQRSEIGVAAVAGSPTHVEQLIDEAERYVWSRPEIEVLEVRRVWWEDQ